MLFDTHSFDDDNAPAVLPVLCRQEGVLKSPGTWAGAGTVWVRFVTVFREDQDLLRDSARRLGHYQPITTNFGGDPTAPIPHRLGTAAELARCTGGKNSLKRA